MRTALQVRQALAEAVTKGKTASADITAKQAALRSANDNDKATAQTALEAARKAYEDATAEAKDLQDELKRALETEQAEASASLVRTTPEGTLAPGVSAREIVSDETRLMAPVRRLVGDIMVIHSRGAIVRDDWIKMAYGEQTLAIIKAQQLTDYATGGALSLPDFAESIIAGLENMTVVRKMRPQVLSVPGSLIMPRETSAPSGSWMGENTAPTPGTFGFGDIKLDPKRLAVEAVVSRKLLDVAARGGNAVRNLEQYIMKRLREKLMVNEDAGFLRGAGTEYIPKGIRFQAAAANIAAISGTTATQIETDISSLPLKLKQANIVVVAGYWIMAPRTKSYLGRLRDANGNKIYESVDKESKLLGHEILETNQIPINLGGGTNEAEIIFANGPSIVVANGTDAQARVSIEGSYQSGATHYSLIQRNEMLIHLELEADCKLERDEAAAVLTAVTY